jgi:hypothetical protein
MLAVEAALPLLFADLVELPVLVALVVVETVLVEMDLLAQLIQAAAVVAQNALVVRVPVVLVALELLYCLCQQHNIQEPLLEAQQLLHQAQTPFLNIPLAAVTRLNHAIWL